MGRLSAGATWMLLPVMAGEPDSADCITTGLIGGALVVLVASIAGLVMAFQGYTYACAAAPEDALWCWGDGTEGLLGRSAVPRSDWVAGLSDVVTLSSGGAHTCAMRSTGEVHCWGFRNGDG